MRAAVFSFLAGLLSLTTNAHASGFDCRKAAFPTDFVICSNSELFRANADLASSWFAARAELDDKNRTGLLKDQKTWLRSMASQCGLPARGRPPQALIVKSQQCVLGRIRGRTEFLARVAKTREFSGSLLSRNDGGLSSSPNDKPGSVSGSPFYRLVMSRDAKICPALAGLYNTFATRNPGIEYSNGSGESSEWENADEFAWAGFHKPSTQLTDGPEADAIYSASVDDNDEDDPKLKSFPGAATLYFGDVLGDGKPRYFLQQVEPYFVFGSDVESDRIFVFKHNEMPRLRYFPELKTPDNDGYFLDPDVIDVVVDFGNAPKIYSEQTLRTRTFQGKIYPSYRLQYWDLAKIENNKNYGSQYLPEIPPDISGNNVQYAFFYDGQFYTNEDDEYLYRYDHKGEIIFTARREGGEIDEQLVLVYKLTPTYTIDDLCYLYHAPSRPKRANSQR